MFDKYAKFLGLWAVAALALCIAAETASAGQVLYDASGFVQGRQSFVHSFDLAGPGTLTVTLSNVTWPEALSSLDLLLSNAQGIVAPEMSTGTASFTITDGGEYFAQWFGVAQGPLNLGVYGIDVEWRSAGTPVSLPISLPLFVCGLFLLGCLPRRRPGLALGHPTAH